MSKLGQGEFALSLLPARRRDCTAPSGPPDALRRLPLPAGGTIPRPPARLFYPAQAAHILSTGEGRE